VTGAALKRERVRLGLTQQQVADMIGRSRETVNRYENGSRRIPRVVERAIAALPKAAARR
jgi:transcriptional regulator with XRE-family HTH domain